MKAFVASLAIWGVLALGGMYVGAPERLLYWSGVALVLFWIVVGSVWLFRQAAAAEAMNDQPRAGAKKGDEPDLGTGRNG